MFDFNRGSAQDFTPAALPTQAQYFRPDYWMSIFRPTGRQDHRHRYPPICLFPGLLQAVGGQGGEGDNPGGEARAAPKKKANRQHVAVLPSSWGTLAVLAQLSENQFLKQLKARAIHPRLERKGQ